MIAIIDYGMGNLRSVEKALEVSGAVTIITSHARDIAGCDKIVLPGVGSFGDAMKELRSRRLIYPIKEAISKGKPFLGLCLGMQLLFEKSEEAPGVKGLGVLKGKVRRFKFRKGKGVKGCVLKIPHMGWNRIKKNLGFKIKNPILLEGIQDGSYMYFVHSYYVVPKDKRVILTTTDYGTDFVSGIAKDNVYGLQFHPEKSQKTGLRILENFVNIKASDYVV